MPNWSDFEPYLRGDMLPLDKLIRVTIERAAIEKTHPKANGPAVDTPVLYFKGKKKGMPLSKINIRVLRMLFGDDFDKCVGQTIYIRAERRDVAQRTLTPIYIYPVPATAGSEEPPTD